MKTPAKPPVGFAERGIREKGKLLKKPPRMGSESHIKKDRRLELFSKGQFSKTRYISQEAYRVFVFVTTKAVLVRKRRQTFGAHKKPSPVGEGGPR